MEALHTYIHTYIHTRAPGHPADSQQPEPRVCERSGQGEEDARAGETRIGPRPPAADHRLKCMYVCMYVCMYICMYTVDKLLKYFWFSIFSCVYMYAVDKIAQESLVHLLCSSRTDRLCGPDLSNVTCGV